MADEKVIVEEASSGSSFLRKWLIRLGLLLVAFLLGFVPMWVSQWRTSIKLEHSRQDRERMRLENDLATATIYARRGDYETGRQTASAFFTDLQSKLSSSDSTIFSENEKTALNNLLNGRDDVITLLSRGDPASSDRLSDLFVAYHSSIPTIVSE